MKRLTIKKIFKISLSVLLVLLAVIAVVNSDEAKDILYLIIISFLISYTIRPIHIKFVEKGMNKRLSAVLLIIIIVFIVFAAVAFLIPSILKESLSLNSTTAKIQIFIDRIYENIRMLRSNKIFLVVLDDLNAKVNRTVMGMAKKAMSSALNIGENVLSLLVVPVISYYFLTDAERIGNQLLIIFPVKLRNIVKKITVDINKVMSRYIVSQLFLCIIIGGVTFIILVFLHIDFPVLLSLINAFFNVIPYFGPIFGAIPSIIMALVESPKTGFYAAIWLYLLQVIEGNILSPKITGDSISMHPLSVILLLIIGEKIGGFLGMVLAVPVGVIIKIIYEDINYYMF